ncbi:MAG: hypothetical protein ACRCWR_00975 [Saezia sp.]
MGKGQRIVGNLVRKIVGSIAVHDFSTMVFNNLLFDRSDVGGFSINPAGLDFVVLLLVE